MLKANRFDSQNPCNVEWCFVAVALEELWVFVSAMAHHTHIIVVSDFDPQHLSNARQDHVTTELEDEWMFQPVFRAGISTVSNLACRHTSNTLWLFTTCSRRDGALFKIRRFEVVVEM